MTRRSNSANRKSNLKKRSNLMRFRVVLLNSLKSKSKPLNSLLKWWLSLNKVSNGLKWLRHRLVILKLRFQAKLR